MKKNVPTAAVVAVIVLVIGGIVFLVQRGLDGGHISESKAAMIREDMMKNAPPVMMPPGTDQQSGTSGGAPPQQPNTANSGR